LPVRRREHPDRSLLFGGPLRRSSSVSAIALVSHGITDPAYRDDDLPLLVDGLTAAGLSAAVVLWNDPTVSWGDFDLVLIRSPWDYPDHAAAFLDWLDSVASVTRVLNSP